MNIIDHHTLGALLGGVSVAMVTYALADFGRQVLRFRREAIKVQPKDRYDRIQIEREKRRVGYR